MSDEPIAASASAPALSIVIPAYQEARRIAPTLERILDYLEARGQPFEVVVVDDGSHDETAEIARGFASRGVAVLRQQQLGKGAAVRRGVAATSGEWVLVSDADLSTPIEELERLEAASDTADLILGSRAVPDSKIELRQPLYRELMGKTFNLVIRSLGLANLHDTQCGFKLVRGDVARELFALMTIDRFAFDIELVWLARSLGYRTVEVGVVWIDSPRSTVRPVKDSARMLWDVFRIRIRPTPRPGLAAERVDLETRS